jgi:hypothetical protein
MFILTLMEFIWYYLLIITSVAVFVWILKWLVYKNL